MLPHEARSGNVVTHDISGAASEASVQVGRSDERVSAVAPKRRFIPLVYTLTHQGYSASTGLVCTGLLLQPIWPKAPLSTLPVMTFGRLILIVVTIAVLGELLHGRRWPRRPPLPGLLLITGLTCGLLVVAVSAVQHGTIRSQGAFYGYVEFVAVVMLLLVVTSLHENSWLPVLLAAAGGSLISDVQALAVGTAHASGSRLSGEFGNPNYLAYATATGTAILLAAQRIARGWWRGAGIVILLLPFTALALTYSRTGAVILGVSIVVIVAQRTTTHRLATAATVALLMSGVAFLTYPLFQRLRTSSDYPAQADKSGWDPNAQGPIGSGPSTLANTAAGGLSVIADTRDSGVSRSIGVVRSGERVVVTFTAISAIAHLPFYFALEDNIRRNGLRQAFSHLTPVRRTLKVRWRPSGDSPDARVYFWSPARHIQFVISRITVARREALAASPTASLVNGLETRLVGSTELPIANNLERLAVASRKAAATFAIQLFLHHPLFGIGWERFDAYAAHQLGVYDPGSAHDEFLSVAAELGIPGVFCVFLCGAGLALRLKRGRFTRVQTVALPPLTGALIGLFFIDAVVTPAVVLPLAATIGVLFTQSRPAIAHRD